jgi:hypothetical protein
MPVIPPAGKRPGPIDVASIVLARIREGAEIKHLFVMVHIILLGVFHHLRAMIDCGATWNFFFQSKLTKIGVLIPNGKPSDSGLKTLDGTPLMTYFDHALPVGVIDINGSERTSKETFVGADMYGVDMILGLPWLSHANPLIRFRERTIVHEEVIHPIAGEVRNGPAGERPGVAVVVGENPLSSSLVVAVVGMQDILDICESEGVDAYLLDLRPLTMSGPSSIVGAALASGSNEIPSEYLEFSDVFSENEARQLPKHEPHDHAIETEGDPPMGGPIYNLSLTELEVLKNYIEDNLAKDFITPSVSPSSAPILFIKKKDGGLRLCVDYRGLNVVTIKNKYPLPLIQGLFDILQGAVRFTKIDIRDAFNTLRIRAGDEWKTAFRCRYDQYEYRVMPFGLANAPASFQAFIHEALKDFLDQFVIVYLDDILIFSRTDADHPNHVRLVLERLRR